MRSLIACIIISLFYSCEKDIEPDLMVDKNPYNDRVAFNGLEFLQEKFITPNAFVELWGMNDSLGSDYDGYLTDGKYDKLLNSPKIKDYSIIVYFDLNSPSLFRLEPGTYTFDNSLERKPGIFNASSYIRTFSGNITELYKITSGSFYIEEKNGYILLEYELKVNNDIPVKGQYTGLAELKIS